MGNILSLKNLSIHFSNHGQDIPVVEDASLEINDNEIVGLVGESGSGKTITTLAITRILPDKARIISGQALFEGTDLLRLEESRLRSYRGRKLAYIFQEPTMFLNPILSVGFQVAEAVRNSQALDRDAANNKAIELLRQVGLSIPEQVYFDYPHQLSGGMNQRIMIAQALASKPKLLIADEPTTNLDIDTENEILDLIRGLQKEVGFSCIFITHNLGLVKKICSRVYVMHNGKIVEGAQTDMVFSKPKHAHSKALVAAYLKLGDVPNSQ